MQRIAATLANWLLLATCAYSQALSSSSLVVASTDGGWYTATEREAFHPNPKSTLRKYLADFRTIVWERQVTGDYPRELRATPDGGVAFLGVSLGRGTLRRFDAEGDLRFTAALDLPAVSPTSLPLAHLASEPDGGFLVASGAIAYERVTQPLTNAFRVSGGSLQIYRISAEGQPIGQAKLPIPVSGLGGLELDGRGNLFVAGSTEADNLPITAGAFQTQRQGGTCSRGISMPNAVPCTSGWIARLHASSLTLQALTYLGGELENRLTALAIDRQGFPLVAGATNERFGGAENPYPRTPGTLEPPPTQTVVATLSRLSPGLDTLVHSTWLAAGRMGAFALAIDAENRILLGGSAAALNLCEPNSLGGGFLMRLSEAMETIERVAQIEHLPAGRIALDPAGEPVFAEGKLPLESGVACLLNGASFSVTGTSAPGVLLSAYGGPFAEDTLVTLDGVAARVLSRSGSRIQFVTPRGLPPGHADLQIGGRFVRRLEILPGQPVWKAAASPDNKVTGIGNYLIEARRSDGEWNSPERPLRPNEEVRAYATGLDLAQPLRLFIDYPKPTDLAFTAEYVPETAEGLVEIRFINPYPSLTLGGLMLLRLSNGGSETPLNPGYLINPFE